MKKTATIGFLLIGTEYAAAQVFEIYIYKQYTWVVDRPLKMAGQWLVHFVCEPRQSRGPQ